MKKRGPKAREWTVERILENTQQVGDCLIWQGSKHPQNYGMMRFGGKMRTVHSVILELLHGRVPGKSSKAKITRTCDNNLCVNPDHLIVKNMTEVMQQAKQTGKNSRFTPEEIRIIRNEYDAEIVDVINNKPKHRHGCVKDLAEKYNVRENHMWLICKRRLYKWVEQEN